MTTEIQIQGAALSSTQSQTAEPAPKRHRLLVTGSREWTDRNLIEQALDSALALLQVPVTMQDTVTLIHGDAKGLDVLCGQLAGSRGWKIESYPARWREHTAACPASHFTPSIQNTCKMAGHRRNHEMIAIGADLVVAFPMGTESSGHSKGTWGCARAAMRAELPTVVLWKDSFYPWGPKAQQLVIAERTAFLKDPAQHTAAPTRLDALLPIPF